jgi:voltage-gated potassium channel
MTPRWRFDILLTFLAAVFLAAYAWPILQPDLSDGAALACRVAIVVTWLAFGVDYIVQLVGAPQRGRWFWRHLPDLAVLVLPILRPLRLLRLVTLLKVMSRTGSSTLRGRVGLYVGGGALLLGFVAALAALDAERDAAGSSITSFGDALWWSVTTMTTVGYGDTYPVTSAGRLIAIGLMLGGVALLGTVTATIASWLVDSVTQEFQETADEEGDERALEMAELREEIRALRVALEDR